MMQEVIVKMRKEDPVKGEWYISRSQEGVIYDASSLALGVLLKIGMTAEDAAWLWKKGDSVHITVAELNAAMKHQPGLKIGTTSIGN